MHIYTQPVPRDSFKAEPPGVPSNAPILSGEVVNDRPRNMIPQTSKGEGGSGKEHAVSERPAATQRLASHSRTTCCAVTRTVLFLRNAKRAWAGGAVSMPSPLPSKDPILPAGNSI